MQKKANRNRHRDGVSHKLGKQHQVIVVNPDQVVPCGHIQHGFAEETVGMDIGLPVLLLEFNVCRQIVEQRPENAKQDLSAESLTCWRIRCSALMQRRRECTPGRTKMQPTAALQSPPSRSAESRLLGSKITHEAKPGQPTQINRISFFSPDRADTSPPELSLNTHLPSGSCDTVMGSRFDTTISLLDDILGPRKMQPRKLLY